MTKSESLTRYQLLGKNKNTRCNKTTHLFWTYL